MAAFVNRGDISGGGGGPLRTGAGRGQRRSGARAPSRPAPLPTALLELTVGPVAHGGSCVARVPQGALPAVGGRSGGGTGPGDLVVFVRHALPGEVVRARVTGTGPSFWRADAVEILTASPDRVAPPCPHAGPARCGGCDWQHATVPYQRALKAAVVREQLRRIARLDVDVVVAAAPLAGPAPVPPEGLGWRTRVRFAVDDAGRAGLHRHRSDQVEVLETCPIAAPEVESSSVLAAAWAPGSAVEVEVGRDAPGGEVGVRVTGQPASETPEAPATPGAGQPLFHDLAGRSFRVSPGSFWQVHPAAALLLSDTVLELLAPVAGERALDLYAGAGLFAARLAVAVGVTGTVLAVEGSPAAAADAVHNLADLPQAMVRQAAVTPTTVRGAGHPDIVVLDPPRTGAGPAVIAVLAEMAPRAVAYVACDPAALARDVAAAMDHGYRLAALRAFDLFPMTSHVECVALLVPA